MSSEFELSCDRYTYADREKWEENFHCELIDGLICVMYSPSMWHQDVVGLLISQLRDRLKGGKCKPIVSPFDVRLFPKEDKSDDTVVQPDVIVVCDEGKLSDGVACRGAPDVVFEVLSGSTKYHDNRIKKGLYQEAGVKEYWVIAKDYAIRWLWNDGREDELRFMRINGVINMPVETVHVCIELDV